MPIKKYTVEVTRVDEYQIEIDTDIWNEERIAEYSKSFSDAEKEEDIVKYLAESISHQGTNHFIEGFGFVKQRYFNSEEGDIISQYSSLLKKVTDEEYDHGLLVKIISHADEYVAELFKK